MDTATLKVLLEKATKGPWLAGRIEPNSATANHWQPYSPWIDGGGPRTVTVGRGIAIHADDMALICAMRNNAEELIASAERAARLEAALRDAHTALFPPVDNGITDDAYWNLMGVLEDCKQGVTQNRLSDISTLERVMGQLQTARQALGGAK